MDPIQIVIVVIIMVVGAVRWVIENIVQKKGDSPEDERPGGTLEDLYEEARREILKRQGRMLPEDEAPSRDRGTAPPQLEPRRQATPPPIPTAPSRRVPQAPHVAQYQPQVVLEPTLTKAERIALSDVRAREEKIVSPRSRSRGNASVLDLLATPKAARQAILLREILGPPKGAS